MKILKFKHNMKKLNNQKKATLVYWHIANNEELLNNKSLLEYDVKKSDNTDYEIELKKHHLYLILFYVGEKGIMFSTIRKFNHDNWEYIELLNKEIDIEIEENDTNNN